MKKLFLSIFVCLTICCISGCVTSYRDGGADGLYRPDTSYTANYYTEYNVSDKRISESGEAAVLFGFIQFSEGKYCLINSSPHISLLSYIFQFFSPTQMVVENAKKAALYNALTKADADQLLGAVYDYTIKNYLFFYEVQCNVKGFPATAKGVKFIDKKPIILDRWQKIEYVAPYETPKNYSGKLDSNHRTSLLNLDK